MQTGDTGADRGAKEGSLHDLSSVVAAAHELKSPLALIRQLAYSLEHGDLSSKDGARILEQITLTSERALRLTSDLTRTMRLDDALFQLEPVNVRAVCEDVVFEMNPLFQAHGRTLKVRRQRSTPLVVANDALLRRIVMHFSDNALHYGATDAPVEVRIQTQKKTNTIRVAVRDYGPAIPMHIWRTLIAQHSTTAQPVHARPQSSGLGLHISRKFANAMGASIGVTRHRDGASFYVDLHISRQLELFSV